MRSLEFPLLAPDQIKVKVDITRPTGCSLLLYKDARVDMQVLDDVVGPFNYQIRYKEVLGTLYCEISIYDEERNIWVSKEDCGVESSSEREKGRSSDALKRTSTRWGVGRELYTAPKNMWVDASLITIEGGRVMDLFHVSAIEYIDRKISYLVIKNENDVPVYVYGKPEKGKPEVVKKPQAAPASAVETSKAPAPAATKKPELSVVKLLEQKCETDKISKQAVARMCNKQRIELVSEAQAKNCLDNWEKVIERCGDVPKASAS